MKTKLTLFSLLLLSFGNAFSQNTLDSTKKYIDIGTSYQFETMSEPIKSSWHIISLNSVIKLKDIAIVPQINYGFKTFSNKDLKTINGFQPQIDFYPIFNKHWYGYGYYGYSANSIFPRNKAGIEAYYSSLRGWELSTGVRFMNFVNDNSVEIFTYTASYTQYISNYILTVRGFLSDQTSDNKLSPAIGVSARRYFTNEKDYLQLNINYGYTANDITIFQTGETLKNLLNSFSTSLNAKVFLTKHLILDAEITYRWEEYKSKSSRNVFGTILGINYRL